MNGKILLVGTAILCPTIGCIYLYAKNRKLRKAFDSMTVVAEVTTDTLEKVIRKQKEEKEEK